MGRKMRKVTTENYLGRFDNERMSISLPCESSEINAIEEQLKANDIPYSIGDLPIMKDGKVVGCAKTITVTDSEKFSKAIQRTSEISYEGTE